MTDISYTLSLDNLHIENSYKIRKKQMIPILDTIFKNDIKDCCKNKKHSSNVWVRNIYSLYWEWVAHNFLYTIHYKRERTKDVDLNYPCDHSEWVYKLIGCLVWVFVK